MTAPFGIPYDNGSDRYAPKRWGRFLWRNRPLKKPQALARCGSPGLKIDFMKSPASTRS
jgi:hypothetical protein